MADTCILLAHSYSLTPQESSPRMKTRFFICPLSSRPVLAYQVGWMIKEMTFIYISPKMSFSSGKPTFPCYNEAETFLTSSLLSTGILFSSLRKFSFFFVLLNLWVLVPHQFLASISFLQVDTCNWRVWLWCSGFVRKVPI